MNLFSAEIVSIDGQIALACPGMQLGFPRMVENRVKHLIGRTVVFGIRPEHISLVDRYPLDMKLRAEVFGIDYLGNGLLLHVKAGDEHLVLSADSAHAPTVGEALTLHMDMTRIQLFDGTSGLALDLGTYNTKGS